MCCLLLSAYCYQVIAKFSGKFLLKTVCPVDCDYVLKVRPLYSIKVSQILPLNAAESQTALRQVLKALRGGIWFQRTVEQKKSRTVTYVRNYLPRTQVAFFPHYCRVILWNPNLRIWMAGPFRKPTEIYQVADRDQPAADRWTSQKLKYREFVHLIITFWADTSQKTWTGERVWSDLMTWPTC